MSRVFGYCRVSTIEQTTDNQVLEIQNAGFNIENKRIIVECISGSIHTNERPEFMRLLDRLEDGDVLVVTKLDRLGRDAINVRSTIELLTTKGVRTHVLALGGMDLTSASGKMFMTVISAFAEFERDLLIERTQAGLDRAKAQGKKLGRPSALTDKQKEDVIRRIQNSETIYSIAKQFNVTRQTIMRIRDSITTEQ